MHLLGIAVTLILPCSMNAHFPGKGCFHFSNVLAGRIADLGQEKSDFLAVNCLLALWSTIHNHPSFRHWLIFDLVR